MKEFKIIPTNEEPISVSTDAIYILGDINTINLHYEGDNIKNTKEIEITLNIKNIRRIVIDEDADEESNAKILRFKPEKNI